MKFQLNGKSVSVDALPFERLLDVLREKLHLCGTKEGCGEGECGACSVFLDGILVNSCLVPIHQVEGRKVQTIEGIKNHPIQKSFLKCGGSQCGICTPGMVMAAIALSKKKKPKRADLQWGLAGNICRCTGFTQIFESVERAGR